MFVDMFSNVIILPGHGFRRALRARDLADLQRKRQPLGKFAYKRRVKTLCQSQKAQRVAAACARSLREVCQAVVRKRGAAAGV